MHTFQKMYNKIMLKRIKIFLIIILSTTAVADCLFVSTSVFSNFDRHQQIDLQNSENDSNMKHASEMSRSIVINDTNDDIKNDYKNSTVSNDNQTILVNNLIQLDYNLNVKENSNMPKNFVRIKKASIRNEKINKLSLKHDEHSSNYNQMDEIMNDYTNEDNRNFEDHDVTLENDDRMNDDYILQSTDQDEEHIYRRKFIEKLTYTKEIIIKQGKVKGIVRNMHPQSGLKDVDQYLGIPYAEAPIGNKRFMPPGAPLPWNGIRTAAHIPPVCPQNLPENGKPSMKFSKGRYDQLVRIFTYLRNESEDCLYLNIYVSKKAGAIGSDNNVQKYPVIVYIHGESYEWNSGNTYDGSVLASYGQVVVVTVNYRLGVLGFLKPGLSDNTVANFGLLDQIAALQWVKDNIEYFGGDSNSVTLMGHGTGAACINFLMISPIAKGLFHRAILMSGSAISDWAISNNSLQLTMQIAQQLGCSIGDDNELINCLRKKKYQEIVRVSKHFPRFTTVLGPIVDGLVVPNQPNKVMEQHTDLFSRYDLLFGVTEIESYHMLNAIALKEGLKESDRDSLLRSYLEHRFEIRPDLALAATLNKYTDTYSNPKKASAQEHRDVILDIFSDARIVAPLIQTGIYHAKVNPRSYMYVFGHNSEGGAHSHISHSIVGEELAFVFGAPLASVRPFPTKYSVQEKLLSEAVMQYWTNFAKTGNPKAPWKGHFLNLHPLEWETYDIDWPEFNSKNQCYVNIGIPPSVFYRYREIYMKFWNKELPEELSQLAHVQPPPFINFYPPQSTSIKMSPDETLTDNHNDMVSGHLNRFSPEFKSNRSKEDSLRTLKLLLNGPSADKADNMYNTQPTSNDKKKLSADNFVDNKIAQVEMIEKNEKDESDKTLYILIGGILLVLILNAIIAMIYFIKTKRKNSSIPKASKIPKFNEAVGDTSNDSKQKQKREHDADESYILDIVKEPPRRHRFSPINGFKLTRQMSASTIDAQIKVADWILQDVVDSPSKSSKASTPTFSFNKRRSILKRPKKVSVAIDATPTARSNSILQQEPIEMKKLRSNDNTRSVIICQDVEISEEFLNLNETDSGSNGNQESISSSLSSSENSNQSPMNYYSGTNIEQVTSFISGDQDINVTSRDDNYMKGDPLSPSEQLEMIRRRNFPKVLPTEGDGMTTADKRKSLPPSTFNPNYSFKIPPTPPPRTVSTLERYPSGRRNSNNITTSPLMLAKDSAAEEEEPKITENTLIFGPLLPKSQENIYFTVKKKILSSTSDAIENQENNRQKSLSTPILEHPESRVKPPQLSSFQLISSSKQQQKQEQSTSKPLASVHRVYPIKDYISRIPQLKTSSSSQSVNIQHESTDDGDAKIDRGTLISDSSSSNTSSSILTIKTDLNKK